MKLNLSIVLHGSSLCKNEPTLALHLVIVILILWFLLDELWLFHSITAISLANHILSLGYFSFPEGPQRWVVLLASPLTITCFEHFHHSRNQLLPFIPLVPPGRVTFQRFFRLVRLIWKYCLLFFPFWLVKENKNGGSAFSSFPTL